MKYLNEKCATCGGELVEKKVEKLLRGGERLYTPHVVELFEKIESELERNEIQNFLSIGQAFQIAS
jgi:hypothetical protein